LARSFAIVFVGEALAALSAAAISATAAVASWRSTATDAGPAASGTWATSAWSAAFGARSRFVYAQSAAGDFLAIQIGHGFRGLGVIGHFYEREAAGLASFAVRGDVDARNLPESREHGAEIALGGLKTQVAYEQILHFRSPDLRILP
jgi:hypothetical protein